MDALPNPQNDGDLQEEDDPPTLSSHALAALKEFLQERNNQADEPGHEQGKENEEEVKGVNLVSEDWRLSQFWYDPLTAETVANEVIALARNDAVEEASPRVACIACPTLYAYIKKIEPSVDVQLLEYDTRFEQHGADFTFYDYNRPLELSPGLEHGFRVVVADPPYLSKECLEKVSETIAFLRRSEHSYVILLTGEVQLDRAAELLGVRPCGFRPQHSSKLGNEFRLFTNYDPGMRLGGWELD